MKSKHGWQERQLPDLFTLEEQNDEVKFDLFVQSRKVKQISQALSKYISHAKDIDSVWLVQNQDLVGELMDDLLDDSMLILDGVQLDKEAIDLSVTLMTDIKKTVGLVQKVVEVVEEEEN